MQPSCRLTPLASAELEIERATIAALQRNGQARTMSDQLHAAHALRMLCAPMSAPFSCGTWLELVRLAGLQALRAAMEDDDMQAMQLEAAAAVEALDAACIRRMADR